MKRAALMSLIFSLTTLSAAAQTQQPMISSLLQQRFQIVGTSGDTNSVVIFLQKGSILYRCEAKLDREGTNPFPPYLGLKTSICQIIR